MNGTLHPKEIIQYIRENAQGKRVNEIVDAVNKKFNYAITVSQMKSLKSNYGITSGVDCRFQKGSIPVNKGTKGLYNIGGNRTSFKKGHTPSNHRPVGSERVNVDGYVEIKVAEPKKWRLKHHVVYEKTHGKIPKRHAILFADGNAKNLEIDNLMLVTKNEVARMNQRGLYVKGNADATKSGLTVAKIIIKIAERKNKKHGKKQID